MGRISRLKSIASAEDWDQKIPHNRARVPERLRFKVLDVESRFIEGASLFITLPPIWIKSSFSTSWLGEQALAARRVEVSPKPTQIVDIP